MKITSERATGPQITVPPPPPAKVTSPIHHGPGIGAKVKAPSAAGISIGRMLRLTTGIEHSPSLRVPAWYFGALTKIRQLAPQMRILSETAPAALAKRAAELRARARAGASIRALVPETLALVLEALRLELGFERREEQLLAAMAMADGRIAEMKTGEGKTFAVACAAALLALKGEGCHVATSDPYLAHRDAELLQKVYRRLGLSVGHTFQGQPRDEKRNAYAADITYGHAETFAFDWLEDQLAPSLPARAQRALSTILVDEADSVMIDEARMPLILAGGSEDPIDYQNRVQLIEIADQIARSFDRALHVSVDHRRNRDAPVLTEAGMEHLERKFEALSVRGSPWDPENAALTHAVSQAVMARFGLVTDREYVLDGKRPVLINDNTGHAQKQSRWRDGLTEAVEQLHGTKPEPSRRTLGRITYQSFLNMYPHLAGTTGTAAAAEEELGQIFSKRVVAIPTHKEVIRKEPPDRIFTHPAFRDLVAVVEVIAATRAGRPVVVATTGVAESQRISARLSDPMTILAEIAISSEGMRRRAAGMFAGGRALFLADLAETRAILSRDPRGTARLASFLDKKGLQAQTLLAVQNGALSHQVLNPKEVKAHDQQAELVRGAGRKGAITVATQMVGRGVDIPLGEGVAELGGLLIVQIGRQTNVRKDEQLRGRAGRQGQPGEVKVFVAPTDALFSFLPDGALVELLDSACPDTAGPLEDPARGRWVEAVRSAQTIAEEEGRVERRHLTELDRVVQQQRRVVTKRREEILAEPQSSRLLAEWIHQMIDRALFIQTSPDGQVSDLAPDAEISEALARRAKTTERFPSEPVRIFLEAIDPAAEVPCGELTLPQIHRRIDLAIERLCGLAGERFGASELEALARSIPLRFIDLGWSALEEELEDVRSGAFLHSYAKQDPRVVFRTEASRAFLRFSGALKRDIVFEYLGALRTALDAPPSPLVSLPLQASRSTP